MVQEESLRRELLRGEPGDGDKEVPEAEIRGAEGEAALRGLQFGAGGVGRVRVPVDRGDVDVVHVAGGDKAEEDGGERRVLGAHR